MLHRSLHLAAAMITTLLSTDGSADEFPSDSNTYGWDSNGNCPVWYCWPDTYCRKPLSIHALAPSGSADDA